MSTKKISSLHDDLELPFAERGMPDFDSAKEYPARHEKIGRHGEFSTFNEFLQFGFDWSMLRNNESCDPRDLSREDFFQLIRNVLDKHYDLMTASIYREWHEMSHLDQWREIESVADTYNLSDARIVRTRKDVVDRKQAVMLIALEGADCMRELSEVEKLFKLNVRMVGIQYNRENALAADGLTAIGRAIVTRIFEYGMIVDMAHALPKTRNDILIIAESLGFSAVTYSHGATVKDLRMDSRGFGFAERRGITEQEISKITHLGGIIGLGVTRPFFQNIEHICQCIDGVCQNSGNHKGVGIGSDFGGVPNHWEIGIKTPGDFDKIRDLLSVSFGYGDDVIEDILKLNIPNWLYHVLPK
ncbi:MAG: membrane dipeptidase [Parcubacteria group bacterium]|jgi:microsomal dipeptidase-like Zn-dependent dipeptidase